MRVDHPGIPCAAGTCSYAATNAKSEAGKEVPYLRKNPPRKNSWQSGLESYDNGNDCRREIPNPHFPALRYRQWLFQGLPAGSKFLAVAFHPSHDLLPKINIDSRNNFNSSLHHLDHIEAFWAHRLALACGADIAYSLNRIASNVYFTYVYSVWRGICFSLHD